MVNNNYKFSVAMSVYKNDNPQFFEQALFSVCQQSLPPDEVFLVVDGPVGEELNLVIDSFKNQYNFFTIKRLEKNGGLGNAMKIAIQECKYDLIFRMDSDDISAPNRFEKQIKAFIEEPVDVLGTWTLGFFGDVNDGEYTICKQSLVDKEIKKNIGKKSPVNHVTVLFKREAVLRSGNYIELFYHEDYYLWARMIQAGCVFKNLPVCLVYVRLGEEQAARHGGKKYYSAEKSLRKYMLSNKLISWPSYLWQLFIRFIYMIILSPKMRCYADKKFKRHYISPTEAYKIIEENKKI